MRKTTTAISVGPMAPASSPRGEIPSSKKRPSNAWPAGFGAFAITVNPPPTTAPCTMASFDSGPRSGHQRREIGDERVVVDRRQDRSAREQGSFRQPAEHRSDPPALQPAVDDEAGQEEADEQRCLQFDATLIRGGRADEAEEEEKATEEQRGIVRVEHRPCHEADMNGDDPRRDRQQRPAGRIIVWLLHIRHRGSRRERCGTRRGRGRSRRPSRSGSTRSPAIRSSASMNGMSHPHGRATISTGGAANCVSVPPIETFTNSTPSVAYFSRGEGSRS